MKETTRCVVLTARLRNTRKRSVTALVVLLGAVAAATNAADSTPETAVIAADSRAVMTGDQVVQILDETVDWYRTLGIQQQAANHPSELLLLYANRQTADQVMALAFEIARANAELLSSEAGVAQARAEETSDRSQTRQRKQLDERRAALQAEIESVRREIAGAPAGRKSELQARAAVVQGELDLLNARRNLLVNMAQFSSQTDVAGFGANALKAHIDAIAASIPASSGASMPNEAAPSSAAASDTSSAGGSSMRQFGIWDLAATVFRLSAKAGTIETIDKRTAELQAVFTQIRERPLEQLKVLTGRGDALAAQTDTADTANLRSMREQYDTIAWLYAQTSAMVTPLSKAEVLLDQYRQNLSKWRELTQRQYREALRALGLRAGLFVGLLALVLAAAALWKRAVFRYVHDPRRRSRFLLLRKIVVWTLGVAVAATAFATELGSLATFAGLITAGLAVAMQSVLVSFVGYFFLIGKYGVRVGDRVQIGNVIGEVVELGLVRLHLMELTGEGALSPTGRVVAFANSVIFQASGGLFKQIAGVNLAWHEITLSVPADCDHAAMKEKLAETVREIIHDYHDEILRQMEAIQSNVASDEASSAEPLVQLRFAAAGVDAVVRYPVLLTHAAEIDERVSRELLKVISAQ